MARFIIIIKTHNHVDGGVVKTNETYTISSPGHEQTEHKESENSRIGNESERVPFSSRCKRLFRWTLNAFVPQLVIVCMFVWI
jgi:hypothetical protein